MKSVKMAIIAGAITVCVIITTIIIVGAGTGDYGLFITDFSGKVDITVTGQGSALAVKGAKLSENSIVTVSSGSSCKLTYKTKGVEEDNYIILEPNTQVIISDDFNGKDDGVIFLLQGAVLNNTVKDAKADFVVRTNNAQFSTAKSVSRIVITKSDSGDVNDFYCFYGNNSIDIYDSMGEKIDDTQYVIEKKKGQITTLNSIPKYEFLNIDLSLDELSATSLKELVAVSNFVDNFPYSTAELRDAFQNAPPEEPVENPPVVPETTPDETTTPYTTTAYSEYSVTMPGENHYVPPATTEAPAQTEGSLINNESNTSSQTSNGDVYHLVKIIVDDESEIQEVPDGGNAEKPEDPVVNGLIFVGWDNSFENITSDTTITALFKNADGSDVTTSPNQTDMCTVTLVVAGRSTTLQVKYGEAANIPKTIDVPGYTFNGWDKDFSYVTSDMTVTALLTPIANATHTVTFVIGNYTYPVNVAHGGTATSPFVPNTDDYGNSFTGWDKPLSNITSDVTITAQFVATMHTVTFIVNGTAYTQQVKHGSAANPPAINSDNSYGRMFLYWDQNFSCVTADMTINAVFAQ